MSFGLRENVQGKIHGVILHITKNHGSPQLSFHGKKVNHFQPTVILNFFHGIFLKSLNPKNGIKTMVFPWLTSQLPIFPGDAQDLGVLPFLSTVFWVLLSSMALICNYGAVPRPGRLNGSKTELGK